MSNISSAEVKNSSVRQSGGRCSGLWHSARELETFVTFNVFPLKVKHMNRTTKMSRQHSRFVQLLWAGNTSKLLTHIVGEGPFEAVEDKPALLPRLNLAPHLHQVALAHLLGEDDVVACVHSVARRLDVGTKVELLFPNGQVAGHGTGLENKHRTVQRPNNYWWIVHLFCLHGQLQIRLFSYLQQTGGTVSLNIMKRLMKQHIMYENTTLISRLFSFCSCTYL